MNHNRFSSALTTAVAAVAAMSSPLPAEAASERAQESAWKCGFYRTAHDPEMTTARYFHCAMSFIMIRVHWSNGASGRGCIGPFENHPFWRDPDGHLVTNAYYIPDPPRVLTTQDGRQFCAASQPAS